ncbi:Bordetella pertussis toxin A [Metarhizium guizhouense ARSEF 977]|uniref:Bordetella pertussis toxin A n=1 Tax=Metarhizium guizhouense (strain ARSEF 977) TaxID=1276136 RepID=A0A0B4H8Z4_METGA|nr:Bordetella pertussis toxin A [Metarhizium guizhouense ARSEF 977]
MTHSGVLSAILYFLICTAIAEPLSLRYSSSLGNTEVNQKPRPKYSESRLRERSPTDDKYKDQRISATDAANKEAKGTSSKGQFFRGDARSPEEIFRSGFQAKGTNLNIEEHFCTGYGPPSGFVSLSRSRNAAKKFAKANVNPKSGKRYIYVITPNSLPDGYWMPELDWKVKFGHSALEKLGEELEFAVAGPVPPQGRCRGLRET